MQRRTSRTLVGVLIVGALAGTGVGITAVAGHKDGMPISGPESDRAAAVALEATGGGEVLETEVGEPAAYYVVEVKRADGKVVKVGVDRSFTVTKVHAD